MTPHLKAAAATAQGEPGIRCPSEFESNCPLPAVCPWAIPFTSEFQFSRIKKKKERKEKSLSSRVIVLNEITDVKCLAQCLTDIQ